MRQSRSTAGRRTRSRYLRRVGGREFAACAGAIIAARAEKIPVILDGLAATAAAAILHAMNPAAIAHCQLAQIATEPGHARVAETLGLKPLLDLGHGAWRGHGIGARSRRRQGRGAGELGHGRGRAAGRLAPLAASGRRRQRRQHFHDACRREAGDRLGALAQLGVQLEAALVQRQQALHDRQAEAGALFGALDRDRALAEGRQRNRNLVLRYARPAVLDRDILAAAGGPADLARRPRCRSART